MEIQKLGEIIQSLIYQIRDLAKERNPSKVDEFFNRLIMVANLANVSLADNREYHSIFGDHLRDIISLTSALIDMLNGDPKVLEQYWAEWCAKIENRLRTELEVLDFAASTAKKGESEKAISKPKKQNTKITPANRRVFIVHGHDEAMKESVARTLTQIGLDPIILHEQPNLGRTIIEKFSDYSNVGFAVVLLSGDDIAYSKTSGEHGKRPRARQNVIFELGYFIGKLEKKHVMALYKEEPDFEIPSDYSGVVFTPFDGAGKWRFDLVKELKACNFKVDANRLI